MHRVWETRSSKIVYKNQYITVHEDEVVKPDGKDGIYGYVQVPRTVGIVALDKNSQLYLCKQPRYIFKQNSWEIPRGFVNSGEKVEDAAKRELAEEAGVKAMSITKIGKLRPSIGLIDEETNIFLAKNLEPVEDFQIQEDEIREVKTFSFEEVLRMIKDEVILDGLTIPAVFLAKEYLHF